MATQRGSKRSFARKDQANPNGNLLAFSTLGKERHLTPEADPHLPVRVAVRMSMGVPGLMEPVAYRGHV